MYSIYVAHAVILFSIIEAHFFHFCDESVILNFPIFLEDLESTSL